MHTVQHRYSIQYNRNTVHSIQYTVQPQPSNSAKARQLLWLCAAHTRRHSVQKVLNWLLGVEAQMEGEPSPADQHKQQQPKLW